MTTSEIVLAKELERERTRCESLEHENIKLTCENEELKQKVGELESEMEMMMKEKKS